MVCPLAKQAKLPFSLSDHNVSDIFDFVHGDVWGPFSEESISGSRYFLTLVDDHSRGTWTYPMKQKSEVTDLVISFMKMVSTQFNRTVKKFRTDNGGEFFSKQLNDFLKSKGTIHQSSCPYTPQQNGVVERKHRHLLHIGRALILQPCLPKIFWGESILTATHIVNKLPSPVLKGKTPGKSFSINHLLLII